METFNQLSDNWPFILRMHYACTHTDTQIQCTYSNHTHRQKHVHADTKHMHKHIHRHANTQIIDLLMYIQWTLTYLNLLGPEYVQIIEAHTFSTSFKYFNKHTLLLAKYSN